MNHSYISGYTKTIAYTVRNFPITYPECFGSFFPREKFELPLNNGSDIFFFA